jgi:RHS repeat-associated protein
VLSITSKSNPSLTSLLKYDGLGRRIAIDSGTNASVETRYLWCGESLCQARTSADVVQRRYYSEGEYLPLGGTSLHYVQDQLGSVRDVIATQNGSRVASFDYAPYGDPVQSNGRVSTDFRYARLFYDSQDGLYLTHYRPYDPRTGRWLSRDPLGIAAAQNNYTYGQTNPLSYIDPGGQFIWFVAIAAFLAYEFTPGIANAPGPNDPTYSTPPWAPAVNALLAASAAGLLVRGAAMCTAGIATRTLAFGENDLVLGA